MKATIWHNPDSRTSRKTLAILQEVSDLDLCVIDYRNVPFTREKLQQLLTDGGLSPFDALRTRGSPAAELGLADAGSDKILDAMVANPILVERPFVETDKGVRLCRPQDRVREIL